MKITKLLRFLLIATAMVMVFSLFACTETPEEVSTEGTEESVESSEDKGNTPEDSEAPADSSAEDSSAEATEPKEETSSETEAKPACQHEAVVDAAVAPTCTEAGLTEGSHCGLCNEVIVAQTPVAALGHNVAAYTGYVANPDGDEAMITGECSACNETVTKPASFYLAVETIYGNVSNENVVVFQADAEIIPLMGLGQFVFANGHANYPADGFSPIALDCTALGGAFNGMIGISGWTGYLGSSVGDSAVFKVLDADGNELVGWTSLAQLTPNAGDAGVDEFLATGYTDAAVNGYRFAHIVDFKPFWGMLNGKTVTVVMAFTTAQGVDGDVYIPYADIELVVPACEHVAGEPDVADNCNVKCTVCGAILEANKHNMSAYAVDVKAPQTEVSACACGYKETREATTTIEGLLLLGPDAIYAAKNNGGLKISVATDEVSGLKYFRGASAKNGTEGNININPGELPLENVGNIIFIIVRKNAGAADVEFWVNSPDVVGGVSASSLHKPVGIALGENFQLITYDISSKVVDGKIGAVRLDLINGTASVADEHYADLAAIGFASSAEAAAAYFKAYINAYDLPCNHIPNKTWTTTDNEGEIAMTCTVCGNFCNAMACAHADVSKLSNVTAKADGNGVYYTADCAICGGEGVDAISLTQEGKKVYTAEELYALANIQSALGLESNAGFLRYDVELVTDENGFTYTRFTAKVAAEGCLFLNDGTSNLTGVDRYVAVLYKTTRAVEGANLEFFYNKAGQTGTSGVKNNSSSALVNNNTWQIAIIDANSLADTRNQGYGWTRLDVLNNKVTVGDEIDIAYMAFFSSREAAYTYFAGYLNYVDCFHVAGNDYTATGKEDEMKVTCTICKENLVVACTHPTKTVVATDVPTVFNLTCSLCGKAEATTSVNDKNLTMFNAQAIFDRAKGDGGTNYSVTQKTEGELDFVRLELTVDKAASSEFYFWILNSDEADITGVSDYFMIVYRISKGHSKSIDLFISNTDALDGTHNRNRAFINSDEWQVAIFDLSGATGYDDTKNVVSRFRLDVFNNNAAIAAGEYLDIAYMGFFASADDATDNYSKAVKKYGFTAANYYNCFDGIYVDGTNYRDNGSVVTKQDKENGTYTANLSGITLTATNSLYIGGWVVAPNGVASVSYKVVVADGTKSDFITLVKPGGMSTGIANATVSQVYGDDRANGCGYQGTQRFDLSAYAGQTVSIEVYVITNDGTVGNILNINNVTVPSAG